MWQSIKGGPEGFLPSQHIRYGWQVDLPRTSLIAVRAFSLILAEHSPNSLKHGHVLLYIIKKLGKESSAQYSKSSFFWLINKAFSRRQRRTLQLVFCYCDDSNLHNISYAPRIFSSKPSSLVQTALWGTSLWNLPKITQSGKEK